MGSVDLGRRRPSPALDPATSSHSDEGHAPEEVSTFPVQNTEGDGRVSRVEAGGVALICISGGNDFEAIREWCDSVTQVPNNLELSITSLNNASSAETRS